MSFGAGRAAKVYANGWDLSSYLNSAQPDLSQEANDTTTFGATARTFLPGLRDGMLKLEGFFDGADDAVDEILAAAIPLATVGQVMAFPAGDAIGARGYAAEAIESNYQIGIPVGGIVDIAAAFQPDEGLDGIVSLHALGAETATANFASVDNGASSAYGGIGYIQATAFSGTSVVAKIQHSADNSVWADLITFTAVDAAHDHERLTVSGTVNRYTRAILASGTFTSVTPVIGFARKNG